MGAVKRAAAGGANRASGASMTYLRGTIVVSILLASARLQAGLSNEVEERLLKIHVTAYEVATPENLSRASRRDLEYATWRCPERSIGPCRGIPHPSDLVATAGVDDFGT